jgi:hypothetical protein
LPACWPQLRAVSVQHDLSRKFSVAVDFVI